MLVSDCWCLEVPGPALLLRSLWMGKDGGAGHQDSRGGGRLIVCFVLSWKGTPKQVCRC